jgi:hypothetical protein
MRCGIRQNKIGRVYWSCSAPNCDGYPCLGEDWLVLGFCSILQLLEFIKWLMMIKSWCQVGGLTDSFCGVNLDIVSINGLMKLVLLGISYNCDGSGDPNAELCLQPLPEHMIPTHGVTMTCSTVTDKGRIFLGGRDGHLYELLYTIGT